METQLSRLELIYGSEKVASLADKRVAVFGAGGVGGYIIEALARSGIGAIDIIDSDKVALSNLNRQIIAVRDTIGMMKTEAAKKRVMSISSGCAVTGIPKFYSPENEEEFDLSAYDYVADAIDYVPGKISLAVRCQQLGVPVISAMGAGNKIHPEMLEIADIYQTSVCPLARVMRRELKKRGVKKLKVVYSREEIKKPPHSEGKKPLPGSTAFVPSCAGLIMASVIINELLSAG
ncbi:tRNA threonylcarbamoyladenosine dehydratase [Ruminococcus sp. Marseille-P6503]|uniref:tRNA threonylcarbamoyladenosine dehydratase n=1 Tax=Ruminococcus sp. Marseille-P6503 TaxID=2364796 RepID=UPI000F53D3FC|nr:tRNA threonylcarbamoyladenosine dehydratase [Ruminococcus sp. Marseille-P6503]